jgi:hypothetical protein
VGTATANRFEHCSNPDCRAPTKGPHTDDARAVHVGVAAHIHAAAPNGPRYDAAQTPDERASVENGIYLCRMCADRIDKDATRFTAEMLHDWKALAKKAADERLGKPMPPPSSGGSVVARLGAIPTGTIARLSYCPDGSEVVHDKFRIEVIGVDASGNGFRFKSVTGVAGTTDSMPLEDVETVWVDEKETPVLRISGFMKHTPLEPYRYVSRPSNTPRSTVVADLLAAKKVDAIERLSKAANLLTSTVMNTMGRGTNGPMRGLCPNILEYTHLIQETRNYYSTRLYDALMAFYSCAQGVYVELGSLGDEDFHRIPVLHGQVETGRHRLTEAMRRELHGDGA